MCVLQVVQVYTYMLMPLMARSVQQRQQYPSEHGLAGQALPHAAEIAAGMLDSSHHTENQGLVSGWVLHLVMELCEQVRVLETTGRFLICGLVGMSVAWLACQSGHCECRCWHMQGVCSLSKFRLACCNCEASVCISCSTVALRAVCYCRVHCVRRWTAGACPVWAAAPSCSRQWCCPWRTTSQQRYCTSTARALCECQLEWG